MPDRPRVHRQVVSYVRRSARMHDSQRRAWERLADGLIVEVPRGETETSVAADAPPLDLEAIFGRRAPLVLEIGSGHGDSPVAYAAAHPEVDVLACEVFEPSVASTLSKIERAGVTNVRICMADGAAVLDRLLPARSLTEIRIFFPDPWHKTRHHKRRLVQPSLLEAASRALVDDGRIVIATDWDEYAEHCREVFAADDRWSGGDVERDADRPLTKYEARGVAAGRTITDLAWTLGRRGPHASAAGTSGPLGVRPGERDAGS